MHLGTSTTKPEIEFAASQSPVDEGIQIRERFLAALVEVQHVLLASREEPFGEPALLSTLGSVSGADCIYLLQNGENPEGKMTGRLRGGWEQSSAERKGGFEGLEGLLYSQVFPNWLKELEAGNWIAAGQAECLTPESTFMQNRGIAFILAFPLLVNRCFAGVIVFEERRASHPWDPGLISLLSVATTSISISQERFLALQASRRSEEELKQDITEREQVEQALRKSEEWIRSLYNITASHQLSFNDKLQALLVLAGQNYDLQTGILARVMGDRYEIVSITGNELNLDIGRVLPLSETFCGETLKAGGPFSIQQVSASIWVDHPAYLLHKIEAYIGTPVVVLGKVFGTLCFSSQVPREKPFTSSDREFLRLIAQWMGGEIEREQNSQQIQKFAAEIAIKNQELSEARDQALEASRQKSDFLATMSHEIRTPMNAIIGMADLLLETPLSTDQKEYAGIVRDSAQVLLTLLNDVLDLSKIEAGKLDLESIDFNLMESVERSAELFVPKIREKGLALMTFVDPAIPSILRGDPNRLSQVLFNLVGNAIKFTERGEVTVRADYVGMDAGLYKIRFSITDTGIGLSPAARGRLFQPFTQADGSTARKYGGTGLGLAISKRLVEMMGGEIGVDSQEGAGSTFWFTSNFDASPHLKTTLPLQAQFSGQRALIVDDSPAHTEILRRYLEVWGLKPSTELSGAAGLQTLLAAARSGTPFRIALIDLTMPDTDGYLLAHKIKNITELSNLILVGVTAYDARGQAEQVLEYGFDGYITKPVQYSRLREKLARLMELPVERAPLLLDQSIDEVVTADVSGLAPVLLAEDNQANQKIISIQLQRLGYRVIVAEDGRKVLEALLQSDQRFSLLLLDCQMPEVDGYSVVRILRKAELATGKHLPVVAMTANAMDGDRETCLASGMDDYLPKPVKLEALKQILAQWTKQESVSEPVTEIAPVERIQPVLDEQVVQGLRALQVEGEDFLGGVIDMFMHEADKLVEQMRVAITAGNSEDLRHAAHTLKGSSAGIGASRLSSRCLELETLAREDRLEECPDLLILLEQDYTLTMQLLLAERMPPGA